MELAFPLTFVTIVVTGYFFLKKRREIQDVSKTTLNIQKKFNNNIDMFPSIFQYILLSYGNEFFNRLYVIITLKKNFCLSQLFFSDQSEFVIIKGFLKTKKSIFYVCNYSKQFFGLKYVTKSKTNVYGKPTENILKFKEKYDINNLYCSYLPKDFAGEFLNTSEVYLKCKIEFLNNIEFIEDFFELISNLHDESENQILEYKKLFNKDKLEYDQGEKKNFVERLAHEIREKSKKEAVKKINKKKKNKRN